MEGRGRDDFPSGTLVVGPQSRRETERDTHWDSLTKWEIVQRVDILPLFLWIVSQSRSGSRVANRTSSTSYGPVTMTLT